MFFRGVITRLPAKTFWTLQALLTCWQLNAARCYHHFHLWWLFAHVVLAVLVLFFAAQVSPTSWLPSYFCLHLCALLKVGWTHRHQWESWPQGLIRLEAALGLHNRLSLALANLHSWPQPQNIPLFWLWKRSLILSLLAPPAVFALVLFLPPSTPSLLPTQRQFHPTEWQDFQLSLDTLRATDLFAEPALAEWQERLDRLAQQDQEGWLSQASLEASQHLREEMQAALAAQLKDLSQASAFLSQAASMQSANGQMAQSSPETEQLLQTLENGALPLDASSLQEIGALLHNSAHPDPRQLQKMQELLQAAEEAIRNAPMIDNQQLVPATLAAQAQRGSGDPARGPGTAPVFFQWPEESPTLELSAPLPSTPLQNATLGDVLGISHRPGEEGAEAETLEPGFQGGYGGSESSPIQQQPATPEERRILQRYFSP